MHSQDFLHWLENCPMDAQNSAARMLARAYAQDRLNTQDRLDAEHTLLVLLERSDIVLRQAIAQELADKEFVSPVLLTSLIDDEDMVADPVIVASPLLRDSELISLFERRSERIKSAIAMRSSLSLKLCRLLCEKGSLSTCRALVRNMSAAVEKQGLQRIATRFPNDRSLGASLLHRNNLPTVLRQEKMQLLRNESEEKAGSDEGQKNHWLEQEQREQHTLKLCMEAESGDLRDFVRHLRMSGQITPSFILRSACWGQILLIIYMASEITGFSEFKIEKTLSKSTAMSRNRLWRQVGLSAPIIYALEVALTALKGLSSEEIVSNPLQFCAELTWKVIEACEKSDIQNMDRVVALLKRIHLHIVRDLARQQIMPRLHHIA